MKGRIDSNHVACRVGQSENITPLIGENDEAGNPGCEMQALVDKRYLVKRTFQILTKPDRSGDSDHVNHCLRLIRCLEKTLKTEFRSTKEFREKTEQFLEGFDLRNNPISDRIKKARRKMGWTQKQLADHLGYASHVPIAQFEKGKRQPTKRVEDWLQKTGM